MRDTITIGTIAGSSATAIMTFYKLVLKIFGVKFITTWDTAANIILNQNLIHTTLGYLIGFTGQFVLGSIFGVVVAYTLRLTGKDYYFLKGVGVGAVVWLSSVGLFMRLLKIQLQGRGDFLTNLLTMFDFILLGMVSSFIIARFANFKVKN